MSHIFFLEDTFRILKFTLYMLKQGITFNISTLHIKRSDFDRTKAMPTIEAVMDTATTISPFLMQVL